MPSADLLSGLNSAQRAAAEATRGPLCIVAGAGSGKTRTITHRIAHQVASGVATAEQILAVTFTDKAARQLRARLQALGLPSPVRAATFHAAAWAQLRFFWPRIAAGPLPDVLTSKVRPLVATARRTRTHAQDLAAEIEWAKARGLGPDQYAAAAAARDAPLEPERMAAVYAQYERDKDSAGLLDYEDMLLRTTAMLTEHPEVAAEVRDRYRYFTVDEFQDVNPAQFALLRAWLGDGDEVCVVGDDDQTIYAFTGATSAYLSDFPRYFPRATVVTLTENYRSTPQVLALANAVLWTKPARTRKRLTSRCGPGPAPTFREFDDDEAEVRGVLARVRALLHDGVPAGQIAVCYRVNSQSEPFEVALRDAGVPYVVRGAGGFYQRAEIRQALTVLRAAAQRPAPAPPPGLEDTTAAGPARADEVMRRVLREQMGYHHRAEPDGAVARERWRNLGALVDAAARATQADPATTFEQVVDDLHRRAAGGADAAADDGAVTLLTLHKAKGLEFDAVFLVALEEGLLPISHAKTDDEVEEERRLLYVGVTRARRHLWLSWARSRAGYAGKPVSRRPSRLLYNLGEGAPRSGNGAASKAKTARVALDGGDLDPDVVERLRGWRRERARADAVPAFVVFNDRTLAELARRRPGSERELLAVTGLGRAKVNRYGDDLLRLLDRHEP